MKFNWIAISLLLSATAAAAGSAPTGWVKAGNDAGQFQVVVEGSNPAAAWLESSSAASGRFGTLMQTIDARRYAGKRVRWSGQLRAQAVRSWGGLWLRVDGPSDKVLAFDNMQDRPVRGDSAWRRSEVVLDVPASARRLAFGFLLDGAGRLAARGLSLAIVGRNVPVTKPGLDSRLLPERPVNLNFKAR
ncbi:MAG: hypothetical protein KGO96_01165 [Elusimicrobia bacterium]|nr:hypothetical protein [Elusimicrobiota bacterium]MDE2237168.1 hypothetical protein [Elusimicrobiota bacterium]MDE2424504.1 hypothetical protein [Elusimicrobiota bacterium]